MEVVKRKILLEDAIYRGPDIMVNNNIVSHGQITADTFYVKFMLTQNIDDMGIYSDISFIAESDVNSDQPDYTILENKLSASGITFPFMLGQTPQTPTTTEYEGKLRVTGKDLDDYWAFANKITGFTDSKRIDVKSYNNNNNFIANFDINKTIYTNYLGQSIDGRSRVTNSGNPLIYVFDANNDSTIGTTNQSTGLLYRDYTGETRTVSDDVLGVQTIPLTEMEFKGEGWNMTNTSLSAQIKEEYLFGVTQPPEVFSDVFIDRGATTVFEKHLRLSEVETLEHFERYNNGFYKLNKQ